MITRQPNRFPAMNISLVPVLVPCLFALPLLFALFCTPLSADTANDQAQLEQLLSEIRDRVNTTGTVQCTFEQERNLSVFDRPILFTGKMALSRPDKLRWENVSPIPSVLIFTGDRGIRCNDDAPPVYFELEKDPIMNMVAEQIWTWVDGDYARLQSKYDITLKAEREIELVPVTSDPARPIASIRVTFASGNLQPKTIVIHETEGDSTTIHFADYQVNQPVDDKLFTACYP
ncbi:MAG TPA: outer membrane lipoprotein carrier protein LolA [Desulfobacteraceae bacterium]|nr:outer membrane lipoprotein carrier protein LolA [Desulfobacteraceae bacterium]